MKDLKKVKYLILDMDGCVYHPKYLKKLFIQVSNRMTEFIALKLKINKLLATHSEFFKRNVDLLDKDKIMNYLNKFISE